MRSLVVLVAMIVATAASALPAASHEWYTGLRSPSGAPCCNERDCRPVAYRINRDTGREEIQANGTWYPVEYGQGAARLLPRWRLPRLLGQRGGET